MSMETTRTGASPVARWALVLGMATLAFFASYRFAVAQSSAPATAASESSALVAGGDAASAAGCSCCGGASAPAGADTSKAAEVSGDVQKINVDTSAGYYDPSTIELKAGIPAEITFSQSSGCLASVQSADLGFNEDLTAGPKTIKLPALEAGTYGFTCGMQMVSGSIVVK